MLGLQPQWAQSTRRVCPRPFFERPLLRLFFGICGSRRKQSGKEEEEKGNDEKEEERGGGRALTLREGGEKHGRRSWVESDGGGGEERRRRRGMRGEAGMVGKTGLGAQSDVYFRHIVVLTY